MQCFSHRDVAAIGICKNCGKGVCATCVREIDKGIVCSEPCADNVILSQQIIERGKRLYSIGGKPKIPLGAWFFGVFGLLALSIAVAFWWFDPNIWQATAYCGGVGVLFFVFAVLMWQRYRSVGLSL
jgi:hypothetical protein